MNDFKISPAIKTTTTVDRNGNWKTNASIEMAEGSRRVSVYNTNHREHGAELHFLVAKKLCERVYPKIDHGAAYTWREVRSAAVHLETYYWTTEHCKELK